MKLLGNRERRSSLSPSFYRRLEALQRPVAEYSQLEPLVAQCYHSGHSRGSFTCSVVLRSARATSFRDTGALAHIYRIFCLSDGIWVKGSRLDRACPLPLRASSSFFTDPPREVLTGSLGNPRKIDCTLLPNGPTKYHGRSARIRATQLINPS